MNIHTTLPGQHRHDLALPADPPEAPSMDGDIEALMNGHDTDLVSSHQFRMNTEECLAEMMKDGELIDLVLAACRRNSMLFYTKELKIKLEEHAGKMLDEAHAEAVKRFQRYGDEP